MEIRLTGRSALITGGSQGLGRAMGAVFSRAGAAVGLVARRAEVLTEARAEIQTAVPGARVEIFPCDVSNGAQVREMFARAVDTLGPVDILVNNAGTARTGSFLEITDADWQADLELKLFAAVRLCRLALPGMQARRWGRIINVLNTGAKAPTAGGAPTEVSRAAGMALTKVLAGEMAPHNVLVNALCTGQIISEQWRRRHAKDGGGKSFEDWVAERGKKIPLGRFGEAEEFANMACFLASDAASYITGTAINVDGGRSPVV